MKKTWIPWSSQGMTYFLYVFHEQALTHIIATQPLDRGIQKVQNAFGMDARLRTSGMTYKDVVCDVTNDRISKSYCF